MHLLNNEGSSSINEVLFAFSKLESCKVTLKIVLTKNDGENPRYMAG